jgi:hypothetical protein
LIANCTCPQLTLPTHTHHGHWPTPAPVPSTRGAPTPSPTPFNTPAGCNQKYFYNCSATFAECETDAGSSLQKTCDCFAPYLNECLAKSGCSTPEEVAQLQNGCRQVGCTEQQCGQSSGPGSCDANAAAQCATQLQSCGRSNPTQVLLLLLLLLLMSV